MKLFGLSGGNYEVKTFELDPMSRTKAWDLAWLHDADDIVHAEDAQRAAILGPRRDF